MYCNYYFAPRFHVVDPQNKIAEKKQNNNQTWFQYLFKYFQGRAVLFWISTIFKYFQHISVTGKHGKNMQKQIGKHRETF